MGILDDLKHKVEKLGDKAKEGLDDARDKAGDLFDDAKDKAGDLLDDAKERFSSPDDERPPLDESSDVGPDSASTDAVQPGYVTGEDDVTGNESDESSLTDDAADDAGDLDSGVDETTGEDTLGDGSATPTPTSAAPAAELDAEELVEQDGAATTETDAPDPLEAVPSEADQSGADQPAAAAEPAVETDVDPFDEPLTETIGDELAAAGFDPDAVAGTVVDADRDSQP